MLEPHWLPQDAGHPQILDATQAAAVLSWLYPARPMYLALPHAASIAHAQRILALAVAWSQPHSTAPETGPRPGDVPEGHVPAGHVPATDVPAVYDGGPALRAALRAWQLHRLACGLPTGPCHLTEAARQRLRLALAARACGRSHWRPEQLVPAAIPAAPPALAPGLAWG